MTVKSQLHFTWAHVASVRCGAHADCSFFPVPEICYRDRTTLEMIRISRDAYDSWRFPSGLGQDVYQFLSGRLLISGTVPFTTFLGKLNTASPCNP